jgi:hypothetical protein
MLTGDAAQRRIEVDGAALQLVERFDVARALVDAAGHPARPVRRVGARGDVAVGAGIALDRRADRIARVGGAEDGENEVGAIGDAPTVERLPEVAALLFEPVRARKVEQPAETEGGVEEKAAQGYVGALELALQQVVGEDHRFVQIVEEMADRVAPPLRKHRSIGLGDRLEQQAVDEEVEVENVAVERFKRIVDCREFRARGGIAWRRRAAAERERQPERQKRRGFSVQFVRRPNGFTPLRTPNIGDKR